MHESSVFRSSTVIHFLWGHLNDASHYSEKTPPTTDSIANWWLKLKMDGFVTQASGVWVSLYRTSWFFFFFDKVQFFHICLVKLSSVRRWWMKFLVWSVACESLLIHYAPSVHRAFCLNKQKFKAAKLASLCFSLAGV